MLRNCGKIVTTPISSSTNQWPLLQNQKLDDRKGFMASSSVNNKVIMAENSNNQAQDPLKCPRCDSSNTKFCYYNNYSLSQPRHFCKACKRYWTRGGTLRNVPVGGGCRKNKRVKRHHSSSDGVNTSSATSTNPTSVTPPHIDLMSSATTNHINSNPMFYNPLELNFPFSNFRVSSEHTGFDLQPQMSNLGLGFSSSGQLPLDEYKNGFKQNIQDVFNGSGNDSILFGSSAFGSSSTMASLLASSLQQHKFSSTFKDIQAANYSPNLMPSEDSGSGNGAPNKEMKVEGAGNRMVWNPSPDPNPNSNPIEQINNSSDPSSLLWNTTNVSAWFDPSNMGSSVPSLI